MDWQPLITAPMDGRRILVRYRISNQRNCFHEADNDYGYFCIHFDNSVGWCAHYGLNESHTKKYNFDDSLGYEWITIPGTALVSNKATDSLVDFLLSREPKEKEHDVK